MIYEEIAQEAQAGTHLSILEMCQAFSVSRAGYYRMGAGVKKVDQEMELRDSIQRIALEMPSYGYRRITHELRRRGFVANHKRVLRLMREDNLLCIRKKGFSVTTDSRHGFAIHPNLVPELEVDGLNQLWVADITYIRLLREFIYLAVIQDAFSRRCIGWALGHTLEAELALAALRMALLKRRVRPELIHHSDRGVQYASTEYTHLLKEHGIRVSMSRKGNPYDNAQVESFIKTLKYEEVYLFEYQDLSEARSRIDYFIEKVYNERRLHSAVGYRPPAEYERSLFQRA